MLAKTNKNTMTCVEGLDSREMKGSADLVQHILRGHVLHVICLGGGDQNVGARKFWKLSGCVVRSLGQIYWQSSMQQRWEYARQSAICLPLGCHVVLYGDAGIRGHLPALWLLEADNDGVPLAVHQLSLKVVAALG